MGRKKAMKTLPFLSICFTFSSLLLLSSGEPCPDPFVTIYNRACATSCAQYGEEYLWCRMRDGERDYCSEDYRHTRYGEACVDGCLGAVRLTTGATRLLEVGTTVHRGATEPTHNENEN